MSQNVRAACERQWASMGAGANRRLPSFSVSIAVGGTMSNAVLRLARIWRCDRPQIPGSNPRLAVFGRTEGLTVEMARVLSEPSKGNDAAGGSQAAILPMTVQTVGRPDGRVKVASLK